MKVKDSELLEVTNEDKVTDCLDFDNQDIEVKQNKKNKRNVEFKSSDSN